MCLRHLLTLFFVAATWLPTTSPAGQGPGVKTRIFRSLSSIERGLGKQVADQIPRSFDFQLFALVWVDLPVAAKPEVKITQLPADFDYGFRIQHSPALTLEIRRKTKVLEIALIADSPCQLGIPQPEEQRKQCSDKLAADMEDAKKTLHLLATPRAHLKTVKVERKHTQPRP